MSAVQQVAVNLTLVTIALWPGVMYTRALWRAGEIEKTGRSFMDEQGAPLWATCLILTIAIMVFVAVWPITLLRSIFRRL